MDSAALLIEHGWELIVLLAMLVLSAFFSGSETALFSLSRGQRHQLEQSAHRIDRLVAWLLNRPQRLLSTLLLGNMFVNVTFSAIAAVIVLMLPEYGASTWQVGVASVVPLLALILFGEVMPKMLAYALARRWAYLSATPIYTVERVLQPLLGLMEKLFIRPLTRILAPRPAEPGDVTPDELSSLLALSARRGLIDPQAGDLLKEIVELTDLHARDVMVPRVDMIAYDLREGNEGLVELFRRTRLRRIPVYDGEIDKLRGVIHAKRLLLHPDMPLEKLIRPVAFVPEAANLERVLMQFRATRQQMAVVVDEYGGTAGLITLEDVLEEIVGDIPDPNEREAPPPVQQVGENQYLLAGNVPIHEWEEAFGLKPARGRISTLGGLLASLLGRIPHPGDRVSYRNLRFTVEAMRGRRVDTVRLELADSTRPERPQEVRT